MKTAMQYLIFHLNGLSDAENDTARHLFTSFPANRLFLRMMALNRPFSCDYRMLVPEQWKSDDLQIETDIQFYASDQWTDRILDTSGSSRPCPEWILSNAAILTRFNRQWLQETITSFEWDVLAIQIDPELDRNCEQVKVIRDQIVGFRRQYGPGAIPDEPCPQWPDHLFCKPQLLAALDPGSTGGSYSAFLNNCRKTGAACRFIRAGGRRLNLFSPEGQRLLLEFSQTCFLNGNGSHHAAWQPSSHLHGAIHIGRNVQIASDSVVIAPAILCDGAVIGAGSVLRSVWVGPSVKIPENSRIQRQSVLPPADCPQTAYLPLAVPNWSTVAEEEDVFRRWPFFSYPRLGKRMLDCIISFLILILFLPFFPIIALAIKLTSPGPVFYCARRQGLHGRQFSCLKFRTMLPQAESMQEQLRFASQVDGPQFKIEDDPRISPIGKFLRDTCIDELPQFLNVLAGQMSIIGPRPSPEKENEFCPVWRDARLSVRPGITGLWQVCRTRQASMDFQEWIYYDTEYVRRISFRTDAWICLKTFQMLTAKFLDQFG